MGGRAFREGGGGSRCWGSGSVYLGLPLNPSISVSVLFWVPLLLATSDQTQRQKSDSPKTTLSASRRSGAVRRRPFSAVLL